MGYALDIFLLVSSTIFLGFSIAYVVYFIRCHEFANDFPNSPTPVSSTTALIFIVFSSLLALIALSLMIWSVISITREKKKNQMNTDDTETEMKDMSNTKSKKKSPEKIHRNCAKISKTSDDYQGCLNLYNSQ